MLLVVLIFVGISFSSFAQDDYSYPVSFPKNISTYTVKKDGSYQEVRELSMRIENEDGASNYGENKISYIPNLESIRILAAYTILPDGSHLQVQSKNIRNAKGDMDSEAASYSDTQYKVIIYPKVAVGSQLYLKYVHIRHTPLFRGQFAFRKILSPHIKSEHFEVNIDFDPRIDIKIYSKGIDGGRLPDKGGMHRYHFTAIQDKSIPSEANQIDINDYSPYVQATSFASYEALGAAYQEKAQPKVRVTRDIQKLADELTMGVEDKRQQTRLLYNWVSKNIRYVGSYIGNGGYVPHDSQTILDNRWGDCKDHVVILEALLTAKGIDSSPALINAGNSYVLPILAGLVFDHVITYVPILDMYLDSTDQFAPFGTLPRSDINKDVVLTGLNKIGRTPPMLANQNMAKATILLKVMPDGKIQGSSQAITSGVFENYLRSKIFSDQSVPQDDRVDGILGRFHLTGSGQIHSSDPSNLDKPLEVNATFTLDPISNFPGPGSMPIPPGVVNVVIYGKMLPKPKDKLNFPTGCDSTSYNNRYEIEFPPNIKITHLPDNVTYSDGSTQYTAKYILNENKLEVSRELVSQYPTRVCGEAENEVDKKFFQVFQRDMRAQVIYE